MKSSKLLLSLSLSLLLSAPVHADPGHKHGHGDKSAYTAGQPGNPKRPARTVLVTMRETQDGRMIFEPSSLSVKKDEQIRFVITNAGELPHEFVLASVEENLEHAEVMKKFPEMEHDEPNNKRLAPKQKTEILWQFTKAGTFEFACLIPGHRELGMLGNVSVK